MITPERVRAFLAGVHPSVGEQEQMMRELIRRFEKDAESDRMLSSLEIVKATADGRRDLKVDRVIASVCRVVADMVPANAGEMRKRLAEMTFERDSLRNVIDTVKAELAKRGFAAPTLAESVEKALGVDFLWKDDDQSEPPRLDRHPVVEELIRRVGELDKVAGGRKVMLDVARSILQKVSPEGLEALDRLDQETSGGNP